MIKQDNKKFAEVMTAIAEIYRKVNSPELLALYWSVLEEYSLEQIQTAIRAHLKDPSDGRFFPTPASIIAKINGSAKGNATEAWPEVLRLASNSSEAFSGDPMTEAAVHALGGWRKIGQTQERDMVFLRKEFIEIYEGYLESPSLVEKSQRLANTSTQRLANGPQRIGVAK